MKIVSSCLAGIGCRYDGSAATVDKIVEMMMNGKAMAVCPEQMVELPIPRKPVEIVDGRVLTADGEDMTEVYYQGAVKAYEIVKLINPGEVILKSKSPSCGCGLVYDGSFSGKLVEGDGLFAALLKENGIKVRSEEDI